MSLSSNAQDFKKVFLGKDYNSYKGLHLKYESGKIGGTSHNFYSSLPTKIYQTPVYSKTKQYDFETDTNAIKNRDFLVVNVTPFDTKISQNRYAIFELNDGKEKLYFVYDSEFEFNFPFLVKGFSYSAEYLTSSIEKKVDEFTGDITYRSPALKDVSIIKYINKNTSTYYLSLETRGSTLNYDGKGVIILFKDGTKWVRPDEKIEAKAIRGSGWGYSAFINLSDQDLKIFSTKEIDKFRLYIYDNMKPDDTDKFPFYVESIIKLK